MTKYVGGLRVPEVGDGNNWSQHLEDLATDVEATYQGWGGAGLARVAHKLTARNEDVVIVVLGDSTGDSLVTTGDEWVTVFTDWLATEYPTHTVKYALWSTGSDAYPALTTVSSGTSHPSIEVWNASAAGRTVAYNLHRLDEQVVDHDPDLVIISHGHNEPIIANRQDRIRWRPRFLALTEQITARCPNAGVALVGQNPRTDSVHRQAAKIGEIAQIAALRGYGFINVHRAFRQYTDDGGDLLDLINDTTHPNAAGQAIWAAEVAAWWQRGAKAPDVGAQAASSLFANPKNLLRNGDLGAVDPTTGLPDEWTAAGSVSRVSGWSLTNGYSILLQNGATLTQSVDLTQLAGQIVTLLVWMRCSGDAPTISITDGVNIVDAFLDGIEASAAFPAAAALQLDPASTELTVTYAAGAAGTMNVDRGTLAIGLLLSDDLARKQTIGSIWPWTIRKDALNSLLFGHRALTGAGDVLALKTNGTAVARGEFNWLALNERSDTDAPNVWPPGVSHMLANGSGGTWPGTGAGHVKMVNAGEGNTIQQFVDNGSTCRLFIRRRAGGVWGSWNEK